MEQLQIWPAMFNFRFSFKMYRAGNIAIKMISIYIQYVQYARASHIFALLIFKDPLSFFILEIFSFSK